MINTQTLFPLKEIIVRKDPYCIDFTKDGKYGVVSNTGSNDLSIIDLLKNEVVKTISDGVAPKRLRVTMLNN